MDGKKLLWLSGICGVISPLVALGCIFLSIGTWHEFSWTGNALSDMGSVAGTTRALFNNGLAAGGIIGMVFAAGFYEYLKDWKRGKIAASVFLLDALSLMLIGVFPGDFAPQTRIHFYVSVAFFTLFPLAGLLMTAGFFSTGKKLLGCLTLLLAAFAAGVWLVHWAAPFGSGVAIPEIIASLCAGVWAAVVGVSMLDESRK